ncbi:MAG: efflux RND transporter permease subunit [Vicinamibacteria bacterium]|nr:efflux RND transporter permease subunit [Vicinamibacteria bacterium]
MQKLAEICIDRPVFATVLILTLVVVGAFGYTTLGLDRFPNVDIPFVTITSRLPGAAPQEMETDVTEKLEEAVSSVSGVDELRSFSADGFSVVMVAFSLEKDGNVGGQEVRERIDGATFLLPRGMDPPIVEKLAADATPVIAVILSGEASLRELTEFADKVLKRNLGTVAGVGQATLIGGRARQIRVIANAGALSSLGLSSAQVVQAIQAQNLQLPSGKVEQGARDMSLRTYGRVESIDQFGEMVIAEKRGVTVRLKDVARIEDGQEDPESTAVWNGAPAVTLLVRKQSGANTVATVDAVRARVESLRARLPKGWKIDYARDQSEFVRTSIAAVQEHLILGSILAAVVVWMFLKRSRPTLIAALSIPASIISAFAMIKYMGYTLNTITLLALTLVVGIVIDDAVIVIENIFRHLEDKRQPPREAAIEGTREIGFAVMATTLSLIAVFLPIGFMGGIVGRFMGSFGITMSFAIFVSLIVAFTFTPMLCAKWFHVPKEDEVVVPVHGLDERGPGIYGAIEAGYMTMLRWAMGHRKTMLVTIALTILATVPLGALANKNFLPTDDEGQFEILVRAPEGWSRDSSLSLLESIGKQVRALEGVEATLTTVGSDPLRTQNFGSIYVKMKSLDQRTASVFQVEEKVREDILSRYEDLKIRASVAQVNAFGSGNNATIQFWVGGPDLQKLEEYSSILLAEMKKIPGVVDADTDLVTGKPELGVVIDREKAADLGVRVVDIVSTLSSMVGGVKVTDFYEKGERYDVWIRAEGVDRGSSAAISETRVPSSRLGTVRLGDLVRIDESKGPAVVNRIGRTRQVLITCNLKPGFSEQAVIQALNAKAASMSLPTEYSYGLTGRSKEQGRSARAFLLAFLSSGVFMYLVLAAQFESWLHPFTILMAFPMTIPFALLAIVMFNQSINIYSALGIMVLFGVVKKNGILQIDHTNNLRTHGMDRATAILQANRDRLRPILMTTLAFVAGMIPLAVSSGAGSATNRSIAVVIIGGQTFALLLTLLAIPVLYALFDDWTMALQRVFRRRPSEPEPAPAA